MKSGQIDINQLRNDANCDFQFLAPIVETIAARDLQSREFRLKAFPETELDDGVSDLFDGYSGESQVQSLRQLEQEVNRGRKKGALAKEED